MVVEVLIWETRGDTVAQRVQYGKVRMKLGQRTKAFHWVFLAKTMCATVRCAASGCFGPGDKVSLFLEDWELARVALSCHVALDML